MKTLIILLKKEYVNKYVTVTNCPSMEKAIEAVEDILGVGTVFAVTDLMHWPASMHYIYTELSNCLINKKLNYINETAKKSIKIS